MAGRVQAFSDPTIMALASERFVPVAENCSPLQSQKDDKGEFFRLVAEQGHYAGRTHPTSTRQGMYAFTADGKVLAAANTRDPQKLAELMHIALQRWSEVASSVEGTSAGGATHLPDYVPARPIPYPEGGLVLQLAARDLPREADTRQEDWRKHAWNLDYAWFTRDEARAIVPEPLIPGSSQPVPWEIVRRLGCFHLRDFVRGEPSVWPAESIRRGELSTEIVGVTGNEVRLTLRGAITLHGEASWTRPEDGEPRRYDTGFDATLYGEATWDTERNVFTAFDLLAAGPRWGTNQYNNRADDLGPAPMSIAFTLAGNTPRDRTPPHTIYRHDYFGD